MTDIALPMLRHHMGAHLIQKDWACYSKTKPEEPCGLCGVRPAYGQFLLDSKIVASCPVSLEKNGATWRAVHQCKYQGKYCKYSLGAAANSTVGGPCSNRPIRCPVPGCSMVVWSYNMATHFTVAHPTAQMSEAAAKEAELGFHEDQWLKHLLTRRGVPTSENCKNADCPCKKAKKKRKEQS